MKENIEYLVKSIVDFPDKVKVSEIEGEVVNVLEISVDPNDVGKIIGKQGRVIKAIRTIAKAATIKDNKRTVIEIVE
ncbi:MAG: KH domain-containing protein [Atribacterota bacterium]